MMLQIIVFILIRRSQLNYFKSYLWLWLLDGDEPQVSVSCSSASFCIGRSKNFTGFVLLPLLSRHRSANATFTLRTFMSFGYPRKLPLISWEAFISFNDNDVPDTQVSLWLHPFLALLETQKILLFPSDSELVG